MALTACIKLYQCRWGENDPSPTVAHGANDRRLLQGPAKPLSSDPRAAGVSAWTLVGRQDPDANRTGGY